MKLHSDYRASVKKKAGKRKLEFRPEFVREILRIRKGKARKIKSLDELLE